MKGVWRAIGLVFGLGPVVWAEELGAVGSRSIHEPGVPQEALEHEHGPRHGGHFGDAEDIYHYEVLLEALDRLVLYVNDELNEPLDVRDLAARWILRPDDPSPRTGAFTPSDDGAHFSASLPAIKDLDPVHVKVEVVKDGAWVGMEFYLPAPRPPD